jgi:hypothetical protein
MRVYRIPSRDFLPLCEQYYGGIYHKIQPTKEATGTTYTSRQEWTKELKIRFESATGYVTTNKNTGWKQSVAVMSVKHGE